MEVYFAADAMPFLHENQASSSGAAAEASWFWRCLIHVRINVMGTQARGLITLIGAAAIVLATKAVAVAQTSGHNLPFEPQGRPAVSDQSHRATPASDAALEIAPRGVATLPQERPLPAPTPAGAGIFSAPEEELPPVPTSGPPSSMLSSNAPSPALPYLGLSVQQIDSHSTPGRSVEGLEIVSVDPGSPADIAGLKGRTAMSTLGASGATAGALVAPLDIAVMPLLKKTGQLGQTGDLIVAIDDRRVTSEVDLATALADSKAGDTIYFTVLRAGNGGAHRTVKIPVKLGKLPSAP
jgi:hypothetical protein